jgi:hypothetical protein
VKIKTSLTVFLIFPLLFQVDLLASESQQVQTEPVRIERLVGLCRLWGVIKYFHPYLAYRDLDWDAALVAAIPKVNSAKDSKEYAAAVQSMLSVLNDPATQVVAQTPSRLASSDSAQPIYELNADGLLLVHIDNHTRFIESPNTWRQLNNIVKEIPKARAILVDLRSDIPVAEPEKGYLSNAFNWLEISMMLTSGGGATRAGRGFRVPGTNLKFLTRASAA